ncbi:MAG: hypothetical protein GXP31_00855 [Kiritimatiellaeota bacterium]|nr:hypothetical protein [Kiritimatiellota bacterium]
MRSVDVAGDMPSGTTAGASRRLIALLALFCGTCGWAARAGARQAVLRCAFEDAAAQQDGVRIGKSAEITHEPGLVLAGRGALKCDATDAGGWTTFLTIEPSPALRPRNGAALVSFRYRIVRSAPDAFLTHFWHAPSLGGAADRGVLRWGDGPSDRTVYAGKIFGLPSQGRIRVLTVLGDAADYRLKFAARGKLSVIIDDLTISQPHESDMDKKIPDPIFPVDGAVLSPEALQFVWKARPPAVRYRLQYSRSRDFLNARTLEIFTGRQRHGCRRWKDGGDLWFTSFFREETAFAPEDLGEGRWFWRVSTMRGEWGPARAFDVRPPHAPETKTRLEFGHDRPLLILYWHHGATIDRDWHVVPEDIRNRCVLRIRMGKYYSRRPDARAVLDSLARSSARGLVQVVQWNIAALPLPLIEEIYRTYPAVAGTFVAEFTEGLIWWGCPPQRLRLRDEYLRRLLLLTKKYGGTLFLAEKNNPGVRPFLRLGATPDLFQTFREARENVCMMWKQNSAIAPYLTQSSVLGLWFAGASRNWGVATEAWYWFEAGFGRLNEVPSGERVRPTDYRLMPPVFLGTMMLLGAAGGAAAYELECPVPIQRGRLTKSARDVVIPLFRRLVRWRLVPARDEVRKTVRAAFPASPRDAASPGPVNDRFHHGADMDYGRLKPLFEAVCGPLSYFAQMIPRGPCTLVPVLPVLSDLALRRSFPVLLNDRDLTHPERLKRLVGSAAGTEKRPEGTAFCAVVGGRIYACNPWENTDRPTWFEAPLRGALLSIRGDLPVHAWLVGVQDEPGRLRLHLNGREGTATRLRIRSRRGAAPEVHAAGPASGLIRIRRTAAADVRVPHGVGWCDLVVTAATGP